MHADWLIQGFDRFGDEDAVIWRGRPTSYRGLGEAAARFQDEIRVEGLEPGSVVSLEADFSPSAVAVLLALINSSCTVVPLTSSVEALKPKFRRIAEVEAVVEVDDNDRMRIEMTGIRASHRLFQALRDSSHPGLVLFSSGSTGEQKASVHDLVPLLQKFQVPRHAWRTITFLLFDHIGGFNTLLYTLSNGGCVVTVQDRSPESVCEAIERHRVQMLPTSPTFVNLLLISRAYENRDMSSLEMVTYGTEVMPQSTLERFRSEFPESEVSKIHRSERRNPNDIAGFTLLLGDDFLRISQAIGGIIAKIILWISIGIMKINHHAKIRNDLNSI